MRAALKQKEQESFNYKSLSKSPEKLFFMTDLTKIEFDCLFECVEPFLDSLVYPDCSNNDSIENEWSLSC